MISLFSSIVFLVSPVATSEPAAAKSEQVIAWRARIRNSMMQADVEAIWTGARSHLRVTNFITRSRSRHLFFYASSTRNLTRGLRLHDRPLTDIHSAYFREYGDFPQNFTILCEHGVDVRESRWQAIALLDAIDLMVIGEALITRVDS